jgi:hypothetical protein
MAQDDEDRERPEDVSLAAQYREIRIHAVSAALDTACRKRKDEAKRLPEHMLKSAS